MAGSPSRADKPTEKAEMGSKEGTAEAQERTAQLAELGLMTASLLHELRDPVFALRARLQLIQAGSGSLDTEATLAALHASIDDIDAMISFYGGGFSGGLGQGGAPALPVDVAAELRRARGVLVSGARRRGIALSIDVRDPSLLVIVRPVTVRQVLMNLVNNALDAASGRDDGRVRVWADRDTMGGVLLGIDDNGPGWPSADEELDALTDPWVTSKGIHGSGLGLYLTRRLLDEAGGKLILEASDLGGARAMARWPSASSRGGRAGGSA